jgi:hypothetical protein
MVSRESLEGDVDYLSVVSHRTKAKEKVPAIEQLYH